MAQQPTMTPPRKSREELKSFLITPGQWSFEAIEEVALLVMMGMDIAIAKNQVATRDGLQQWVDISETVRVAIWWMTPAGATT